MASAIAAVRTNGMSYPLEVDLEFSRAAEARSRGNEGRARVCARRAAGIAVKAYFSRKKRRATSSSAVDLLNQLSADPQLPDELKLAVQHLTLRVDEKFELPADVDLIADARKLCDWLLA